MKVIDSIMFCNEFDILELRLNIMADYVDQIVIVECDRTFSGIYKGFNLETQWNRYKQWHNKINYIKVENSSPHDDAWANEDWQRDQMALGWQHIENDDVILFCDCDEIVRPEAIEFIRKTNYNWYGLYMPAFYFKFNYLDTKQDWHYKVWGRAYRGWQGMPRHMRYMGAGEIPNGTSIKLHHAGWHFGWIGNEDFIKNKIRSFSHQEINTPNIIDNINIDKHITEGRDHFRPENTTWVVVDLDDYFPKHILDNKSLYQQYILSNTGNTVRNYWSKNILETE